MFVIIDRTTKRVLGFTEWEEYAEEHSYVELIRIPEEHKLFQIEKPQDYMYDENTKEFIYLSDQPSEFEKIDRNKDEVK